MRSTRKGRKRLQAQKAEQAQMLRVRSHSVCRLSRRGCRYLREQNAWRQIATAAAVSALAVVPTAATEASSVHVIDEVPAAFQTLLDARNRIRDFHAAQRNVQEASEALAQAEVAVQQARQSQQDAVQALDMARQSLAEAQARMQLAVQELESARQESAKRTQEALVAQQAVADFAPDVWNQETVVQDIEADRNAVQQRYDYLTGGNRNARQDELAARIEAAWQSVNYEQNRLADVMAMVYGMQQETQEAEAQSAAVQESELRLQDLDAAIETEEAQLEWLNSQMDALEEAREAAEEAEEEARELVRDLVQEQSEAENDVREAKKDCEDTARWKQEADAEVSAGEQVLQETQSWKTQADYELDHFGTGAGMAVGFEYYNWHGSGEFPHGHQLYQPIEASISEKQWEFSLSAGWLTSDTGWKHGHVSGWTDTILGAVYKNDHTRNDIHYGVSVNVPTGREDAHQNAMMADNLARYNSFGEGWQLIPSVEAIHHITERDSLHGSLSYAFRGDYEYRAGYYARNDWNGRKNDLDSVFGSRIAEAESVEKINPGGQFRQEAEYRHIGEDHQFSLQLAHTNASHSSYRTRLRYWMDDAGSIHPADVDFYSGRNEDGQDWTLRVFDNYDVDSKNSLRWYGIGSYQSGTEGGMHRYYGGVGWQHSFDNAQSAYILLNYGEVHGRSYNWHLGRWDEGRHMKSVLLGYSWRLNERDALLTKYERYVIHGGEQDTYHGWNIGLMFNHSF